MRYQLDAEAARWFRHGLLRPVASARFDATFTDKLREAWNDDEGVLDLSKRLDDKRFLGELAIRLAKFSHSNAAIGVAFVDLAEKIAKVTGLSVVDRLGALYEGPPTQEIKAPKDLTREWAIERLRERREGR
jgi:hypothetical protein